MDTADFSEDSGGGYSADSRDGSEVLVRLGRESVEGSIYLLPLNLQEVDLGEEAADFFGAHIASDKLYADEVGDIVLLPEAKRYYAEMMMPFTRMVASGLDKAKALQLKMIAPNHGPVHREPGRILEAYEA